MDHVTGSHREKLLLPISFRPSLFSFVKVILKERKTKENCGPQE